MDNMNKMTDARALEIIAVVVGLVAMDKTFDPQQQLKAAGAHIAARLRGEAQAEPAAPAPAAGDADAMCPNCVTPWKCNGPHEESGAVAKLPDGCTESNCPRCLTHPDHRGDMVHAGIGSYPPAAPAPVAGDAVSRLPDELMDASDVEDSDGNLGASIAFADAAGRLRAALAQDRASQAVGDPVAGDAAGVDQRFTEMLLSILNDVQTALGFTDEEKECANGSAEILEAIRDLKLAALAQDRASQAGYHEGLAEGIKIGEASAAQAARMKQPPCVECGAKTQAEAEGMCICSGDKDDCHGCELWPGDASQAAAPSPDADGEVGRG